MRSRIHVLGTLQINGAGVGDLIYFDEDTNGDVVSFFLPIPTDWLDQEDAGTPYVLGIAAGIPAWRRVAADVVTTGWGISWGTSWGF